MLYAPIVSTSVVLMIVITRRMETRPHFNFRFFFSTSHNITSSVSQLLKFALRIKKQKLWFRLKPGS